MKKEEAKIIAPEKSKLLMEYINQILSDNIKVEAKINIDSAKIGNEKMCTYDIYVPEKGFEKHLDTGITMQQSDVLREQILIDLIDNFMESETMGVTRWTTIRGGFMGEMDFDGVVAVNTIGSTIRIDFGVNSNIIKDAVDEYNLKLKEYAEREKNKGHNR